MPEVQIDFSGLATLIVNALVTGVQTIVTPLPTSFEQWLLTSIQKLLATGGGFNLLTHIPTEWTTGYSAVTDLWRQSLLAELGISTVVIVIQGYRVTHGKVDLWDAVARTGFFIVVGFAMVFWAHLIFSLVNLASDAVGTTEIDVRSKNLPNELVEGAALIVGVLFALLAMVKGAIGVVFLNVLIVSAPFLLPLSALPLFEGLGKWWAEEFTTWTLRPFMVALVLRLGLGITALSLGGLEFLFVIAAFWLAWTMDTRLRKFSMGAWGSVGQLNMFSRGASALAGAFGGPAVAPAAGAATAAGGV